MKPLAKLQEVELIRELIKQVKNLQISKIYKYDLSNKVNGVAVCKGFDMAKDRIVSIMEHYEEKLIK